MAFRLSNPELSNSVRDKSNALHIYEKRTTINLTTYLNTETLECEDELLENIAGK